MTQQSGAGRAAAAASPRCHRADGSASRNRCPPSAPTPRDAEPSAPGPAAGVRGDHAAAERGGCRLFLCHLRPNRVCHRVNSVYILMQI